jgi:hypothetical protein
MKNAFRLIFLAAAVALGCWLWTVFFPGPEKLVLRKIASLATIATIKANDSNIIRVGKAANLVGYFSPDAQITVDAADLPVRSLSGRDEIREFALAGFTHLASVKVEFLDVTTRLGADQQTADVTCTARVYGGASKDFGVQELHFQLKKIDGEWLITRAETVKTLS